jgi:O-antigen ligase
MTAGSAAIRMLRPTLSATTGETAETSLLRFSRATLYLTVGALPLYTVRWHYGPLPTTLLETLILITVGTYVAGRLRQRALRPVRTPLDIAVVVLLAVGAISVVVATDHRSALGLYRAYFLEPVAIFYVAVDLLRTSEHLKRLFIAFALGSSVFAVMNLVVFYRALIANAVYVGFAPSALYGDANYVAMYMEPPFALAAALVLLGQGWRWKIVGAVWLTLTGSALVASFSKGAYMGVAVLMLVAVLTVPRWRWVVAVSVAASAVIATQVPLLMARLATVTSSLGGREQLFGSALTEIRAHPLFGDGLGGYTVLFRGLTPEIYPHDIWLTFWVEIGVGGVIAFAVILFTLLWQGWRAWPRTTDFYRVALWGALGALVIWLVHGFVDSPYWKNDLSAEFWILAAITVVVVRVTPRGIMTPGAS